MYTHGYFFVGENNEVVVTSKEATDNGVYYLYGICKYVGSV